MLNTRDDEEVITKHLRGRVIRYTLKKRAPFKRLITIPRHVQMKMLRSGDRFTQIRIWKLNRKWEIVEQMRATYPEKRINSKDSKYRLITQWRRLDKESGQAATYWTESFQEREDSFDPKNFDTAQNWRPPRYDYALGIFISSD